MPHSMCQTTVLRNMFRKSILGSSVPLPRKLYIILKSSELSIAPHKCDQLFLFFIMVMDPGTDTGCPEPLRFVTIYDHPITNNPPRFNGSTTPSIRQHG